MNKSILVIDTPMSCEDCELCTNGYICLRLGEVDESVENGTIDLRCPLKPMPQKLSIESGSITNTFKDSTKYMHIGYNDCIDELLGEQE